MISAILFFAILFFAILFFAILFFASLSFAGNVRTLRTSSNKMPVISLMTGRSTVLRFTSPPKKVVVGNQNYFNIEFIDSDITIQPLQTVSSNIFIYGDGYTYGFILKSASTEHYDDLVFVKNEGYLTLPIKKISGSKDIKTKFPIAFKILPSKSDLFQIDGNTFYWSQKLNCYYADLFLSSKNKSLKTKDLKVQLLSKNKEVSLLNPTFETDDLKDKSRVRVFSKFDSGLPGNINLKTSSGDFVFSIKWKN